MKKLSGLKKSMSSLENKKLTELKTILGGLLPASNDQWTTGTCNETNGNSDTEVWVDGVRC